MKIITQTAENRMHKKLYILLITIVISLIGFSQNVGINSTGLPPNANAGLDIDFPNMGLLIPRVALTGTLNSSPLTSHVAGMEVYNTATAGDVTPGFYYNNGTKWITGFLTGTAFGNMLYWNGTAWVLIPAGLPGQYLQMSAGTIPSWSGATLALVAITTTPVTVFTMMPGFTMITGGGNITSDGGTPVAQRGICWKTTTGPTIADSKTIDGSGIGIFASSIPTPLLPASTYFVRAYSINFSNVTYGNEVTFITPADLPTLGATNAATLITASSATSGGSVTATGGATISEWGLCYSSTNSSPTILDGKLPLPMPGIGSFSGNITGLSGNTTYYVRSYAINSAGPNYGTMISFKTLISPPTLTTVAATTIGATTATAGGTAVLHSVGFSYGNYGIAYSTVSNSTTPTFVSSGYGYSVFPTAWTTNLTGLLGNTTYFIRSYLDVYDPTVVYGLPAWSTSFGNELTFTTSAPTAPIVASTNAVSGISDRTATSGGVITSDGGGTITAKGVCWSTSPINTNTFVLNTSNSTNDIVTYTGANPFTSNITGLTGSTIYYVRAYATNSIGTSYGPVDVNFTTWVTAPYTIGQNLGYGYCAYVDATGHGLVVSNDIPFTGGWGCSGTSIVTSGAFGSGPANTTAILAACADRPIAASVAAAYNGGGFTDWYLPSSGDWSAITGLNGTSIGLTPGYNNYYTSSQYTISPQLLTYVWTAWYNTSFVSISGALKTGGTVQYINYVKAFRNF